MAAEEGEDGNSVTCRIYGTRLVYWPQCRGLLQLLLVARFDWRLHLGIVIMQERHMRIASILSRGLT